MGPWGEGMRVTPDRYPAPLRERPCHESRNPCCFDEEQCRCDCPACDCRYAERMGS